jgi:hypothetical protein
MVLSNGCAKITLDKIKTKSFIQAYATTLQNRMDNRQIQLVDKKHGFIYVFSQLI